MIASNTNLSTIRLLFFVCNIFVDIQVIGFVVLLQFQLKPQLVVYALLKEGEKLNLPLNEENVTACIGLTIFIGRYKKLLQMHCNDIVYVVEMFWNIFFPRSACRLLLEVNWKCSSINARSPGS